MDGFQLTFFFSSHYPFSVPSSPSILPQNLDSINMRFLYALSTLAATWSCTSAASLHKRAGGFAAFCENRTILDVGTRAFLTADCTIDKKTTSSALNLDFCLNNDNGVLTVKDIGHFADSCQGAKLDNGTFLSATCKSGDTMKPASIDLDTFVTTNQGALSCNGHEGCGDFSTGGKDLGDCNGDCMNNILKLVKKCDWLKGIA
ncbi:hypothetical protein F5Y18DRAFT_177084 [Xylariaceae sp. FL1019]|nr:hypothetical protein F5Y18DRAFT_177084 [Xylariaceae sp. FL1019]